MEAYEINFLADVLRKRTGIVVGDDKVYLLENRLKPVADKFKISNITELVKKIQVSNDEEVIREVSEAMTTNETLFFRDHFPFETLKKTIIPEIMVNKQSSKTIRIWCSACSTGQEPYSIAILLNEMNLPQDWHIEILATDISQNALNKAKTGLYSQFEVQRGLPAQLLVKYFIQQKNFWKIIPEIKNMVTFREFNLLDDMVDLGKKDIVFCRNVLIYFDHETKKNVVEKIRKQVDDEHGYLFLGTSEALFTVTNSFILDSKHKGLYRSN